MRALVLSGLTLVAIVGLVGCKGMIWAPVAETRLTSAAMPAPCHGDPPQLPCRHIDVGK